jgi:hypothetical protein
MVISDSRMASASIQIKQLRSGMRQFKQTRKLREVQDTKKNEAETKPESESDTKSGRGQPSRRFCRKTSSSQRKRIEKE